MAFKKNDVQPPAAQIASDTGKKQIESLADLLCDMAKNDKNAHLSDDEVEAITLEIMADEDD